MSRRPLIVVVSCDGKGCKKFAEFTMDPDRKHTMTHRLTVLGWLCAGDLDFCPVCKPQEKKV